MVGPAVTLGLTVFVTEAEVDTEMLGDRDIDALTDTVAAIDGDTDAEALTVACTEGEMEPLAVTDEETVVLGDIDGETVSDAVTLMLGDMLAETLLLTLGVTLVVALGLTCTANKQHHRGNSTAEHGLLELLLRLRACI